MLLYASTGTLGSLKTSSSLNAHLFNRSSVVRFDRYSIIFLPALCLNSFCSSELILGYSKTSLINPFFLILEVCAFPPSVFSSSRLNEIILPPIFIFVLSVNFK